MSELIDKQEVLSDIAFAMVDDFPDLQRLYDKIEGYDPMEVALNENQQIVLEYLKEKCDVYSFISYRPFEAILPLNELGLDMVEIRVRNTIDELNRKQQAQVLQAFGKWVEEQEEE